MIGRCRSFLTLCLALTLSGCEVGVEQPAGRGTATGCVVRGNLRFVDGFAEGYAEAAAQGKPMLLFFTATWCQYCHQMADEAFTLPQVVNLSERFVCILIDADREPEVCRQFAVSRFPTLQFLSPRGTPSGRIVGKQPGHRILMSMQAALQQVARGEGAPDSFTR